MTDIVRFTNGFLALPDGTAVKGDLYVSQSTGAIIAGQDNFFSTGLRPSRTIDLDGGILSPGLIDVQINGAYGVDFSDLELSPDGDEKYLAGLDKVAAHIVETGTTALVPTIITQKEELYAKVSCGVARWRGGGGRAGGGTWVQRKRDMAMKDVLRLGWRARALYPK